MGDGVKKIGLVFARIESTQQRGPIVGPADATVMTGRQATTAEFTATIEELFSAKRVISFRVNERAPSYVLRSLAKMLRHTQSYLHFTVQWLRMEAMDTAAIDIEFRLLS